MFNIEKFSKEIGEKIGNELKYDENKKAIIAYGIFGIIQTLISILLVVIFGYIFNVLIGALITTFTISILRKFSGGVHASNPTICAIVGTVVCILVPIISKGCRLSMEILEIVGGVIFIFSYYLINKLAPVDSKNKPIKTLEKRNRLKNKSKFILVVYGVIFIILVSKFYLTKNYNYEVYALSLCGGVIWQVFSLTKIGHVLLSKLDCFLNKLNYKKECT